MEGSADVSAQPSSEPVPTAQRALIHETCLSGRVQLASDAFCQATGFSAQQWIGSTHALFAPLLDGGCSWIDLHSRIGTGGLRVGLTRNKTAQGADLWLWTAIVPKFADQSQCVGFLCASVDVTMIHGGAPGLDGCGTSGPGIPPDLLTATVAHEIRNPLGAIRTATFVLERKLNGKVDGVAAQLERINTGIRRCDKIITDLLDYSRKRSLDTQPVEVDQWLQMVLREEARKLESIDVQLSLGLPNVVASFDPDQLRQVVVNLVNNACEAMVEHRGRSATADYRPRLHIRTRRTAEQIEIEFADNGPGISEENLRRIRQPLFTTKSFGVGLGISAVERILRDHGGHLNIHSILGSGATMTAAIRFKSASL